MRVLDIENIGRIGQMLIDGDLLKDVMADPFTCDEDDINYNIPAFNALKRALSKTERLNPDIYLSGILWQWYPANKRMVAPAVVGRNLPGNYVTVPWMINDCPPLLAECMKKDKMTNLTMENGFSTFYFPIKTSAGDIIGALELNEREMPLNWEENYAH